MPKLERFRSSIWLTGIGVYGNVELEQHWQAYAKLSGFIPKLYWWTKDEMYEDNYLLMASEKYSHACRSCRWCQKLDFAEACRVFSERRLLGQLAVPSNIDADVSNSPLFWLVFLFILVLVIY
jgi:hypothetical protein